MNTKRNADRLASMEVIEGNSGRLLCGLRNLGNTCFMNCVLQCVSATAPLSTYFVQGRYRHDLNRGTQGSLAEEYAELVKSLWLQSSWRRLSPRFFKEALVMKAARFAGTQQHDCVELCIFLLDCLHGELNRARGELYLVLLPTAGASERAWASHANLHDSLIVDLFQGQLHSTIMCMTCEQKSSTFDPFMFLTLPIPIGSGPFSLEDCLRLFCKPEQVLWRCPQCKQDRECTKQMGIYRMPPVLLIHLMRFSNDGPFRRKILTLIRFPTEQLDMAGFVAGPPPLGTFSLYGVCNHIGTVSGGHYTSYCKNAYTQRWHHFNDSSVTAITESAVCGKNAYLLFYTSVDFRTTMPSLR